MNHVLCGLAANEALPVELVDRLIAVADADIADGLASRTNLSHKQAVDLATRVQESAVRLAYEGRLTAADVDPLTQPQAALALLDERCGDLEWARLVAADPDVERRAKLAACPELPADVREMLADDPDVRVVAELASQTEDADLAARLARHPHAEVRRTAAANEATPPQVLAMLITGEGLPPAERCLVCDIEETPYVHDPHGPQPDCDLLSGAWCTGSHESTLHEMAEQALWNPVTPIEALVQFADHPSDLLRTYGPGSRPASHGRYALIGQPETLVILERMEAAPFLLRGRWEKQLETVFLDDLEFAWGPRIRVSR